jgi:hypothetical protein
LATRTIATLEAPQADSALGAVRATVERLFVEHHYRPPFVLVEQWSTADEEHFAYRMPGASVVAAWVRDGDGLRPIDETERAERHAANSKPFAFTLVQFFIEPDHKHVVMAVVFAPKAAHGGRYSVATGPSGPVLVGDSSWQA